MEILKARGDSGTIEPGLVSGEGFNGPEVGKELSTIDEFEDQVEVLGVLGKALEIDNEGVADLGVDEVFIIDVVDLLGLDNLALVEEFECNVLSGLFVLGHLHLTEPALSEDSTDFVVLQLQFSNGLVLTFLHGIFLNIDYNQIENHLFFYNFQHRILSHFISHIYKT